MIPKDGCQEWSSRLRPGQRWIAGEPRRRGWGKGSPILAREPLFTGIDVGASKVCAVVSSSTDEPLGLAVARVPGWPERLPSTVELASTIAAAIAEADGMARSGQSRCVWIALNGAETRCLVMRGMVKIGAQDMRVDQASVERAVRAAVPPGGEIIHQILVSTVLDGVETLEDPSGRVGQRLEACVLVVEALPARCSELHQAAVAVGFEVRAFLAGVLALGSVLTPAEREIGTAVVDLGAAHTSVVIYARGGPRYVTATRLGGNHVTRDLAVAVGLSIVKAEELKLAATTCPAPGRSEALIDRVMTARQREILELLRADLGQAGWTTRLPGGYVLTGGGALSNGMPGLVEKILGGPVRLGLPQLGQGREMLAGPAYAVALGISAAARAYGEPMNAGLAPKGVGRWRSKLPRRSLQA